MKTRTKIIIPIVLLAVISIFYIYISMNGYSPYVEGISMTITPDNHQGYMDDPEIAASVYQMVTQDFVIVPKLKVMMDILLEQEYESERRGYGALGSDVSSYWINTDSDEIRIKTGMSNFELLIYEKWMHSNQTFLFEYKGTVFQIGSWIA